MISAFSKPSRQIYQSILLVSFMLVGSLSYASQDLDELREKLKTAKEDTAKVNLLNALSWKYVSSDNITSMDYANKALNLAKKLHYKIGMATAYKNIGGIYFYQGEYSSAFRFYNKSLKFFKESNDLLGITKLYNNLASVYYQQGNYQEALPLYLEALKISKKINDKKLIARTLSRIGVLYYAQEDTASFNLALEYFNNSLKMDEKAEDDMSTARIYYYRGAIFQEQGKFEESLSNFLRYFEISDRLGSDRHLANAFEAIGAVYENMRQYDKVEGYYVKSLELRKKRGDKFGIANSYVDLGSYYSAINDLDQCIHYFEKARKLSEEIGSPITQNKATKALNEAYARKKNYAKAYTYLNQHKKLSDSLFSKETAKKLTSLQMKFDNEQEETKRVMEQQKKELEHQRELDNEKTIRNSIFGVLVFTLLIILILYRSYRTKQKVNKILEKRNKEILEQKEQLVELNATKDKFFSIIAHDLRNPFNALINFSKHLVEDFDKMDEASVKELHGLINESSKHGFRLLENLLDWSRSQTGRIPFNPEVCNLHKLVDECMNLLGSAANNKSISFKNKVLYDFNVYADANMMNTVIRNLLSNAIKFTGNSGNISVTAERNGHYIEISIADDGIGISHGNMKKLFRLDVNYTNNNHDDAPGTGLGLILCKEFVEKNNGRIWAESLEGSGSTFKFSVPSAVEANPEIA